MSKTEHTSELWQRSIFQTRDWEPDFGDSCAIIENSEDHICFGFTDAAGLAYMDRIVACVNGCKGIHDPEVTVPEVVEALRELVEVAALRGDSDLPAPPDDPKLWTARMQDAWLDAEGAIAKTEVSP